MKGICVFCGSSPGAKKEYSEAIQSLGRELAGRGLGLVYGGGKVGLMGLLAEAVLAAGGQAIGVIPRRFFDRKLAHKGLTQLHVVESMHERKALMAELSDAFIAAPGGFGTIEEIFEALTWAQLGLHNKPCGILNTCGYYDKLLEFLDAVAAQQFLEKAHRAIVLVDQDPARLLDSLASFQPPRVDKAAWALRMSRGGEVE